MKSPTIECKESARQTDLEAALEDKDPLRTVEHELPARVSCEHEFIRRLYAVVPFS